MSKHVLIIGGGVIGLCSAYYCAARGCQVTVVEREPEQRDGCSFQNAGLIVPSHFVPMAAPGMIAKGLKWMWNPSSPFYVKPRCSLDLIEWGWRFWRAATAEHVRRAAPLLRDLSLASRDCFEELAALPQTDFGLVKKGLLMLCKQPHTLDEEAAMAEKARALGIPAETLDARQTAALDPGIRMAVAGSVFYPQDCHLAPDHFMTALLNQLKQVGVRFQWNSEVESCSLDGNRALRAVRLSDSQELEADEFILCGGVWSPAITRALGLNLPMQAGKGYSLTLPSQRSSPQIPAIFTEARVAVTPLGDALRFGGTMEMAGMNNQISPTRVRGIIEAVPKYYPELNTADFDPVQPWSGLRPCSPDGMPYLGRIAKFNNLLVAAGHAMMGLSLGPITGRIVADLVHQESSPFDLAMLSPDRYN